MTGAQHYEIAEQLLASAQRDQVIDDGTAALVHSVLGLAAAAAGIDGGWSRSAADRDDWKRVLFPELVDA